MPDRERWHRLETICDAALRLETGARESYLGEACGDDHALRHDVDALLAHQGAAQNFLAEPIGALAAAVMNDAPRNLIGRRLGDYEITARLGEGGMGEVYRARDRKLGRDVAIKVLPAAVANDQERLKRFEREARLLASVNHPAIGAIYGLVEAADLRALVLELIEGETLAARLERGPIKLDRALAMAAQICDALDHAHRRGVTHRDLKPSNVMLSDGGVKVLDFGVGKWASPSSAAVNTRESTLTHEGAIVGTLHYMAPEQLEGRVTDARSDIFSFGAVLYEMLSGRRAFDGPSQASIIAAVLDAPPPKLSGFASPLAPRLQRVVDKCLAKSPDDRWQSARDLGDELRWLQTEAAAAKSASSPALLTPARRTMVIAAGVALLAAGALVGWVANWRSSPDDAPSAPMGFEVQPKDGLLGEDAFDISADGSQIAYKVFTGTGDALYLRRLDRFDAVVLPTSGFVGSPKFSPDGQWIAFFGDGALRKVSTKGNAPPSVLTSELSQPSQLSQTFQLMWRTSDAVFVVSRNQPIRRVAANGGRPENVTTMRPETDVDHHGPESLPSGRAVLFAVHGKRNRFSIAAQDLVSGERKTIIESGFSPVYSPTGHLLFARGSAILAVRFDERSLEVSGDAVTLVERVQSDQRSGVAYYRVSKNGTLVFQPQRPSGARQLMWVDRTGRETPVPVPAQSVDSARLSPDGKQLTFSAESNNRRDIYIYALASGALTRLTQDADNWGPIWTPDGGAVIYGRDGGDVAHVVRHPLNGGPLETLGSSLEDLWPADVTRDGQHLIVTGQPPTDEYFLARLDRGSVVPQPLLQKSGFPRSARLSPDGRSLAYVENVGNQNQTEIFIQGYPEPGQRRQVSVEGGSQPVWRRDGKELFFRYGSRMFGVSIDTATQLQSGRPTLLFDRRYLGTSGSYDVAADGRFLMIKRAPSEDMARQLNVIVNWRNELLARVPVPK